MTYQPHGPETPVVQRGRDGISTVAMSAVFLACTLVVMFVLYALNRDDQTAATTSSPAPTVTTGQSQAPEPKAEPKGEPKAEQKADPKSEPKSAEPKAK
jgi:hypothetical protein